MRVWVNGEEVGAERLYGPASPLRTATGSPLNDGPCLPIFVDPPPAAAEASSATPPQMHYHIEVEAAAPGTFVTLSHVLWR